MLNGERERALFPDISRGKGATILEGDFERAGTSVAVDSNGKGRDAQHEGHIDSLSTLGQAPEVEIDV